MAGPEAYRNKYRKKPHRKKLSFICIFLISFFTSISAQEQNLHFHRLSVEDGLPQNSVNCITQDRHGFMWFGTQDGLARYDGYDFKTYRNEPGNPNSLSNNYIWDIHEDTLGILWICSFGGGLTRFDPATETFTHFKREDGNNQSLSNNNTFKSLRVGNDLWVCTNDGVSRLNTKTGQVTRYANKPGKGEGHAGNYTGSMAYEKPGILWVGSDEGLIRFNLQKDTYEIFPETPFGKNISLKAIRDLRMSGVSLLISATTHFLKLDFESGDCKVLMNSSDLSTSERVGLIRNYPSSNGGFWIGTGNGLVFLDMETGEHRRYRSESPQDRGSLPHNAIHSIFRSADGILWIGTQNGLGILYHEKSQFSLIRNIPGKNNTLSSNNIKGIVEDGDGLVWIATVDGLNAWDRTTGNFTVFENRAGDDGSLSSDYILSLLIDENEALWIGTRSGGVNKLMTRPGKPLSASAFQRYGPARTTVQHMMDDGSYLWLGTSGHGLIRMKKNSGEMLQFHGPADGNHPSHPYVFYLLRDSFQNFWLGTATGGLNLFDETSGRFLYILNENSNPNSLSNNLVLCIFEDSMNRLWVGTAAGLNRFKPPLQKDIFGMLDTLHDPDKAALFQNYGRYHGLPNEVIYGIQEDESGFLWLSTNDGLVKFDPDAGKAVKTYDVMDGLQSNEHNQNAFFTNEKGEMYFGGVGGLNVFHPASISGNSFEPPVVITDIKLFNTPVPIVSAVSDNDATFALDAVSHMVAQLELSYHHDVISFDFAALSYINPDKNTYRYKLEGFDKDWIDASEIRSATYTNLDPGKYTLRIRAANNDGLWNEKGTALELSVSPAPWRTWWAYLMYIALAGLALYYFVRQRIYLATRELQMQQKIERAKSEERAIFRKQSAQDFHDEAGNKITRINLYNELARAEAGENTELQKYLENIQKTTRELASGTRDFIWVMDPEKDTLFETVMRIKDFGETMFGDANVAFHVIGLKTGFRNIKLSMDSRRAMLLIFKEAMNNCAKYALATDVTLMVNLSDQKLHMELRDNGRGFDSESPEHKKGYGTGIMKERAEKIGGNLTIRSEIDGGTRVSLSYKIPQMGDASAT